MSVVYGLYYAVPLVFGATDQYYNAPVDARTDYGPAVILALYGWVMMTGAYILGGLFLNREARSRTTEWRSAGITRFAVICLYGGLVDISITSMIGSGSLGGLFQFFLSLHWLGAGLLTILARRKELSRLLRGVLIFGVAVAVLLQLSAGNIAPMVMLLGVIGFASWIANPVIRKRSLAGGVALLLIAMSFRGVAIEFRKAAWFGPVDLSRGDKIQLMGALLQQRIQNQGVFGTLAHGVSETAGRSANMDLFANVIRRTPAEVPYWKGQTYLSLVGSFVPRILWQDKPTKEMGQAFGHRYNYIYVTNTSTAINLPILVEFFVNFGTIGVIIGMFLVGIIYRVLDFLVNRPGQSALVSMIGAVLLIPLLPIESDFSLIFGGLPLNGLSLYLVWRFLTRESRVAARRRVYSTAPGQSGAPSFPRSAGNVRPRLNPPSQA